MNPAFDFPTPRHAVSYIMETFPIVKRKDETNGQPLPQPTNHPPNLRRTR